MGGLCRYAGLVDLIYNEGYQALKDDQFTWRNSVCYLWLYASNVLADNHNQPGYFRDQLLLSFSSEKLVFFNQNSGNHL